MTVMGVPTVSGDITGVRLDDLLEAGASNDWGRMALRGLPLDTLRRLAAQRATDPLVQAQYPAWCRQIHRRGRSGETM